MGDLIEMISKFACLHVINRGGFMVAKSHLERGRGGPDILEVTKRASG